MAILNINMFYAVCCFIAGHCLGWYAPDLALRDTVFTSFLLWNKVCHGRSPGALDG
jgi:hypothetical protein